MIPVHVVRARNTKNTVSTNDHVSEHKWKAKPKKRYEQIERKNELKLYMPFTKKYQVAPPNSIHSEDSLRLDIYRISTKNQPVER